MFDALLDEMRAHSSEWLHAEREALVGEQRRLHTRELAITRVLDERGQIDEATVAADGVSARTARETIETARALEALPEIGDAACAGALSIEQLAPVVQLASEADAGEWARRAQHMSRVTSRVRPANCGSRRWRRAGLGIRRAVCGCGGTTTTPCSPSGASCRTCWAPRSKPPSTASPIA
jgi:hypothetical protein